MRKYVSRFGHYGQFKALFPVCKSEGGTANCPSEYVKEFSGLSGDACSSGLLKTMFTMAVGGAFTVAGLYLANKQGFINVVSLLDRPIRFRRKR